MSTESIQTCMVSQTKIEEESFLSYAVAILLMMNVMGVFILSVVLFLETHAKASYHRVKNTPPKLKLTREYLDKMRVVKRMQAQSIVQCSVDQTGTVTEGGGMQTTNEPSYMQSKKQQQPEAAAKK